MQWDPCLVPNQAKKLVDVFPHLYKFETSTSCLIKLLEQRMSNERQKLAAFGCVSSFSLRSDCGLGMLCHKCPDSVDPHHFRDRHPSGKSGKHETSAAGILPSSALKSPYIQIPRGLQAFKYNYVSLLVLCRGIEGLQASLELKLNTSTT